MKKILMVCGLLLGFLSSAALAQSTEADVSARIIGKPLLLRGFWMSDKLQFDSNGQPLEGYETGSFTESAFDAQKVKIHGDHLRIEGQRMALSFTEDGSAVRLPLTKPKFLSSSAVTITIVIDGQGNSDFSKELNVIFASSLGEIVPSLPDFWQSFAQKHFLDKLPPADEQSLTGGTDTAGGKALRLNSSMKPPRVLHSANPKFSDTARQMKFSGKSLIRFSVGPDGVPSHLSIAKPAGLGLDEKAVASVSKYQFAPATKDGEPVTVELAIEVNFQIL